MRSALVALVLGISLIGARPAPAAPFTSAFDNLKVELETRRDNDFGGTLDAAKKKQQKAVLKSLALIGGTASRAVDDMKTFSSVAKLLERAYPDEMATASGSDLWEAVYFAFNDLHGTFNGDYFAFRTSLGKVVPSSSTRKAAKILRAADVSKDKPNLEGILSVTGRNYLKAWKLVLKGLPLAQAGDPLPDPSMDFTVDIVGVSTNNVYWAYHAQSRVIHMEAEATDPGTGDTHHVAVDLLVTPGSLDLGIDRFDYIRNFGQPGEEYFDFAGGTFAATTLDLAGHRFEGSFDVSVMGTSDFGISGTFVATWFLETFDD